MISFETVVERAINGPICTERDFDLGIFVPNLRKVLEKCGVGEGKGVRVMPRRFPED